MPHPVTLECTRKRKFIEKGNFLLTDNTINNKVFVKRRHDFTEPDLATRYFPSIHFKLADYGKVLRVNFMKSSQCTHYVFSMLHPNALTPGLNGLFMEWY